MAVALIVLYECDKVLWAGERTRIFRGVCNGHKQFALKFRFGFQL